jgi:transcription elongation factor Elf1
MVKWLGHSRMCYLNGNYQLDADFWYCDVCGSETWSFPRVQKCLRKTHECGFCKSSKRSKYKLVRWVVDFYSRYLKRRGKK